MEPRYTGPPRATSRGQRRVIPCCWGAPWREPPGSSQARAPGGASPKGIPAWISQSHRAGTPAAARREFGLSASRVISQTRSLATLQVVACKQQRLAVEKLLSAGGRSGHGNRSGRQHPLKSGGRPPAACRAAGPKAVPIYHRRHAGRKARGASRPRRNLHAGQPAGAGAGVQPEGSSEHRGFLADHVRSRRKETLLVMARG
jgi:hypothetical protein